MKQERIPYKGMTLLPVKKDLVFKAVFANESDLEPLASLLSSILGMGLTPQILTVNNVEIAPTHGTGKMPRLDIRVKIGEGSHSKHINVELQLLDEKNIEKRSLFYLSKLYTAQVGTGMEFKDIFPAIAINILDYNFLPFDRYHNRYRMKNMERDHELTDVFEVNFIELKKVSPGRANNMKDLWMQYLTADSEEVIDMLKEQSPVLGKAVERLVKVSADEKLRFELEMREKAELEYMFGMAASREEGVQEGLQKGRQEVLQGKLNFIKRLLADGVPIDKVAQYTDMTKDEIQKLYSEA